MKQSLFGATLTCSALVLTATIAAQSPQTPATATQPSSRAQAQPVTVEGCVTAEADVPGRKPNIVERAGIAEDYILTSAKIVKGSAPGSPSRVPAPESPTGTSGTQAMYEIEGLDEEQLKPHIGRRVQIDGTFENVDRATASPERGTPADDLVEIRGTAIRQVAGDCSK